MNISTGSRALVTSNVVEHVKPNVQHVNFPQRWPRIGKTVPVPRDCRTVYSKLRTNGAICNKTSTGAAVCVSACVCL